MPKARPRTEHTKVPLGAMKGFSLIELMIVVTIMSILSAVAIPAYQDYVLRAKVTHMLAIAQPTKLAVTEAIITGSTAQIDKIANKETIKEIAVSNNVITITGDSAKLGLRSSDRELKLTLTPDLENPSMIFWKCTIEPTDYKKYAPNECRG